MLLIEYRLKIKLVLLQLDKIQVQGFLHTHAHKHKHTSKTHVQYFINIFNIILIILFICKYSPVLNISLFI